VLLNPFVGDTEQGVVALPPGAALSDDALQLTLKFGGGVTVKLRLNVRVKLPLVPTTSIGYDPP
jgi:hypothetical protein